MNRLLKICLIFTALLPAGFTMNAQSSHSRSNVISFTAEEVRSVYMLPNIEPTVHFKDANRDNVLNAKESAEIIIVLKNTGGPSEGVEVTVVPSKKYNNIVFNGGSRKFSMAAGEEKSLAYRIDSDIFLKTDSLNFTINVRENQGFDAKAVMTVYTECYPAPQMKMRGVTISDFGIGTRSVGSSPDGKVQVGETVWARISLQNVGEGPATGLSYMLESEDPNILLLSDSGPQKSLSGRLSDLSSGKTAEIEFRFSPNYRYDNNRKYLPIKLSVKEESGFGNMNGYLPIKIGVAPDALRTFDIKPKENHRKVSPVVVFDSSDSPREGSTIRNIMMAPVGTPIHKNAVAVVIGAENNKYSVPALYAAHDAEVFAEYLGKSMGIPQGNILMLSNEEVTFSNMRDIFNPTYGKLRSMVTPDMTDVFVFYSGHGIPFRSEKGAQDAYLLPYDARKEDICNTGYSLDRLCGELNSLRAKSVTMIVDACFSGASRASGSQPSQNLANTKGVMINMDNVAGAWTSNPRFRMLTSCAEDETSLSYDISQSGLFTYYLALGLQGDADGSVTNMKDGSITMKELYNYVYSKVVEEARKLRGSAQTPHLYGDGEFLMEKIK